MKPALLLLAFTLMGCVSSPKIEVCNVKSACLINAPATVEPIQLPKELP